jgi:hypothetical protein
VAVSSPWRRKTSSLIRRRSARVASVLVLPPRLGRWRVRSPFKRRTSSTGHERADAARE